MERFAFYEGAVEARPVTHIVIKLLTLITVYLTALFFTNAVQGFKARGAAAQTLIYALPLYYRDGLGRYAALTRSLRAISSISLSLRVIMRR